MKIVAISDTHLQHNFMVPEGDVLIHAGDGCNSGSTRDVGELSYWLNSLPHPVKIYVPGNHDRAFQSDPDLCRVIMGDVDVLIDQELDFHGIKFYGSPWQPEFCNWAFNLPRGKALKEKWDLIPDNTQILITHGPPSGVLDKVHPNGPILGCEDLYARLIDLPNLKYHIFGHIHGGNSKKGIEKDFGVEFHNVAVCNEQYSPIQKPHIIDWKLDESR